MRDPRRLGVMVEEEGVWRWNLIVMEGYVGFYC